MAKKSFDDLYKVMLIGDSSVGKSSIINRAVDQTFNPSFISTIGVDFKSKIIDIKENIIKLQLWDTAGQERFHSITYSFYRGADAIVLVYDVTNANSFQNLSKWIRNIEEYAHENVLKIIVGNKADLEELRTIPTLDGQMLAKKNNVEFLETSAKTNMNIDKLLVLIATKILEKKSLSKEENTPDSSNSSQDKNYVGKIWNMITPPLNNPKNFNCC